MLEWVRCHVRSRASSKSLRACLWQGMLHGSLTSMTDAAAQYKKQDGVVTVSADGKTVSWKSASGAAPLSIAIADIGSRFLPVATQHADN